LFYDSSPHGNRTVYFFHCSCGFIVVDLRLNAFNKTQVCCKYVTPRSASCFYFVLAYCNLFANLQIPTTLLTYKFYARSRKRAQNLYISLALLQHDKIRRPVMVSFCCVLLQMSGLLTTLSVRYSY